MENQQMAMPAEMAPAGPNPEEMAIYEQMRQQISPQEFSNEMLASASQIDPQAVAEFTEELRSLDVSPEELDALNDLVDEILASPEQYEQLRQKYLAQGLPDDILPEQFDPNFFAAMNMAVDQMIAAPTGVQAFAEGGIAELKPIAKAIASYGRNGDTMLAHITPAEARMLRRRGGSGTINPHTGLPEFFLKKAFKSIGKAVKKFASSTVGRLVTTVALGFFLGPAAASVMGVGAGTAAGMAISGFVGGAGSTLLGGGNLKDALKAGAIGGLTAGVAQGLSGAPLTGPATMTPGQALQGRVDQFTGMFKPGAAVQAPTPGAGAGPQGIGPNQAAVPPAGGPQFDVGDPGAGFEPMGGGTKPSIFDQGKRLFNENISPSGIREGATPAAQKAGADAVNALTQRIPTATPAMQEAAYQTAFKAAMPGTLATYGPMAAVGLGTIGAFGGFQSKPVEGGDITKSLNKPVTQRIREQGNQSQMYLQGLPGVVYDDMGAPVFGQSTRLPTYDVPDYNLGGFGSFGSPNSSGGQGIMNLPSVYTPPAGTMGSRRVEQPYNNASMYSNLLPRGYEGGGDVVAEPAKTTTTTPAKTPEQLAAERRAATEAMMAQQKAGRDKANQARAQRLAAGSGQMYNNINAGIAALAPETNPMDTADTGFGARNRQAKLDVLNHAYAPMLQGQRNAMNQQAGIAASGQLPSDVSGYSGQDKAGIYRGLARQGLTDAQIRAAAENRYGMQSDADWKELQATVGDPNRNTARPVAAQPAAQPSGDFGHFGIDQYGRRAGEGFGTAPPPGSTGGMYSNITRPGAGYTGPNLYAQALSIGMPSRDAARPAYQYTPLAPGATRQAPTVTPTASSTGDMARKQAQYQALLGQGATDAQIRYAGETMFGPQTSADMAVLQGGNAKFMNMGGIAALGQGGYPRRTGQISGPGTEKSDSIPAMLSDGEFVMTAKAVRGAGKGSRRAGAKQMYKLMHQLEKNSERG